MDQEYLSVPWEPLRDFTKSVFTRVGLPSQDAEILAEVLIWANLRGVDSHGVQRIPTYVEAARLGRMNPTPNIRLIHETPATLLVDADHAYGPVVSVPTMERVIHKAENVGIGWGLIRNSAHQGAIGYYAQMAAQRGMAGLTWTCNPPNMAPTGAKAPGVHNSPVAIAVPRQGHRPMILDMATSVVAGGKIDLAIDKGEPIPLGWALDKEGNPTTDPKQLGCLLPAGGYKGYGLALMFECLSSVMVGNPLLSPRLLGQEQQPLPGTQNAVVAAINIAAFTGVDGYAENVDALVRGLKGLPRVEGCDEVLVPGELEERTYEQRLQSGIPLPSGCVRRLRETAAKLEVELPPGF